MVQVLVSLAKVRKLEEQITYVVFYMRAVNCVTVRARSDNQLPRSV